MLKCLHIFGAYFYRLARKHSTIVLIIVFIFFITAVLHLYVYKHQDENNSALHVGEFDYQPAAFLKGKLPENVSYCQFNYGFPESLQLNEIFLDSTPEAGTSSSYRVIYNAIQGTAYANYSSYDAVTYVTQATPEFLYHVVEIARYWDGPISLSTFVPSYDLDLTMQIMNHLCHCYRGMSKVSLHLFFPKRFPPTLNNPKHFTTLRPTLTTTDNVTIEETYKTKLEKYKGLDNNTRHAYIQQARQKKIEKMIARMPKTYLEPSLHFKDCAGANSLNVPTFRRRQNMIYPINVGRNVARNASRTNYFVVSDIELVPSDGLATKFLTMLRKLMGDKKRDEGCIFSKTVFVVPLFEVERGEEIPHDKDTLVKLVSQNRAKYFHQSICPHCQRFPGLQSWLTRVSGDVIEPMLIARREHPYHRWEPLYFGTQNEPWYSELLSWEGRQDKMTQMLEMCLQGYRMVVLDGGFLCHAASSISRQRFYKASLINRRRYLGIIASFKRKYPDRPKCRLMWGC